MCETEYLARARCTHGHRYHRRHLTKAEHKELLQKYADDLTKELQAVNERIETL